METMGKKLVSSTSFEAAGVHVIDSVTGADKALNKESWDFVFLQAFGISSGSLQVVFRSFLLNFTNGTHCEFFLLI